MGTLWKNIIAHITEEEAGWFIISFKEGKFDRSLKMAQGVLKQKIK